MKNYIIEALKEKEIETNKFEIINILRDGVDFERYINDNSFSNPFIINENIEREAYKITNNLTNDKEKGYEIFQWFEKNVQYDNNAGKGYKNSKEVFNLKKGICGEMTFLYVIMARYAKIDSSFVHVKKDFRGKKVAHACASLNDYNILVDPAYQMFDVKHKNFKIIKDFDVLYLFNKWRSN